MRCVALIRRCMAAGYSARSATDTASSSSSTTDGKPGQPHRCDAAPSSPVRVPGLSGEFPPRRRHQPTCATAAGSLLAVRAAVAAVAAVARWDAGRRSCARTSACSSWNSGSSSRRRASAATMRSAMRAVARSPCWPAPNHSATLRADEHPWPSTSAIPKLCSTDSRHARSSAEYGHRAAARRVDAVFYALVRDYQGWRATTRPKIFQASSNAFCRR